MGRDPTTCRTCAARSSSTCSRRAGATTSARPARPPGSAHEGAASCPSPAPPAWADFRPFEVRERCRRARTSSPSTCARRTAAPSPRTGRAVPHAPGSHAQRRRLGDPLRFALGRHEAGRLSSDAPSRQSAARDSSGWTTHAVSLCAAPHSAQPAMRWRASPDGSSTISIYGRSGAGDRARA